MYKKKCIMGGNNLRNLGKKQDNKIKTILISYLKNNIRDYGIITIIFVIGLIFGIIFINNANQVQIDEISTYINNFITSLKQNITINQTQLLQQLCISNFILTIILWFVGFCLGYTISSCIATLGSGEGTAFVGLAILLQNILFIPCILSLAVSGMKLYKSILKDKRKENIKLEVTRHTIFSGLILIGLEISAFVEVYISTNLLQICSKYF